MSSLIQAHGERVFSLQARSSPHQAMHAVLTTCTDSFVQVGANTQQQQQQQEQQLQKQKQQATADTLAALQKHIDKQTGLVQQLRDDNAALHQRLETQAAEHSEEVSLLQRRIEQIKAVQTKLSAKQQSTDQEDRHLAQQVADMMDTIDGLKSSAHAPSSVSEWQSAQAQMQAKLRKRQSQLENAILQARYLLLAGLHCSAAAGHAQPSPCMICLSVQSLITCRAMSSIAVLCVASKCARLGCGNRAHQTSIQSLQLRQLSCRSAALVSAVLTGSYSAGGRKA